MLEANIVERKHSLHGGGKLPFHQALLDLPYKIYNRGMILVTGISGVGKSYTIERVVAAAPKLTHVRASQLLAQAGRPISQPTPSEMEENQRTLGRLLVNLIAAENGPFILDGHAVLETHDGPIATPTWIFDAIPISAILCVRDDPVVVAIRRRQRHGPQNVSQVQELQKYEEECSRDQARRLGIPFRVLRSGDLEGFKNLLDHLIGR